MSRPSHPSAFLRGALLLAAAISLTVTASGCGGAVGLRPPGTVWPAPPEKPRFVHVRTFVGPEHFPRGFWRGLVDFLIPHESSSRIRQPTGLALSPDEQWLYVASAPGMRVVRVNWRTGQFGEVASAGRNSPTSPFGVALDAEERLYVSDKVGGDIWVFGKDGSLLNRFGKDRLISPHSIAIDRSRQLLYVINGASSRKNEHTVEVFSLKGEHLRTIGKRGAAVGEFNFPSGITVAPDGRLFVVDMLNFRVQVFAPDGSSAGTFGQIGDGMAGSFDKIKGIAFDAFGNVYVTDALHGIQVFSPDFKPLTWFADGRFIQSPNPIVITSKNEIFVGDYATGPVNQFQLINTSAEDSFLKPEAGAGVGSATEGTSPPKAP